MQLFILLVLHFTNTLQAQSDKFFLLKADRVFDGETMHTGLVGFNKKR